MGLISKFFGGEAAAKPIEALGQAIDSVVTSDEERAAAEIVKEKIRQQPAAMQAAINLMEAQHRSVFVAGWRPFLGWVCGWNILYTYSLHDFLNWCLLILNQVNSWTMPPLPAPSGEDIMQELVMALLGLAGMRSWEKMQGRAK